MIEIRNKVFETNSSMTHTLVICKEDNYNAWINGKLMFKFDGEQFLDAENARKENAKVLRERLKWYKDNGLEYRADKFNDEIISKYENGAVKDRWALFSRWDIDNFFITYDQFTDYVWNNNLELVGETSNVDGVKMTVFGYYGND